MAKGRNYQAIGDRFSRGLCPMPRVYASSNSMSGQRKITRLTTNRAVVLDADVFARNMPVNEREALNGRFVQSSFANSALPPHRIRVCGMRPHFGGARLYWVCPRCGLKKSKLWALVLGEGSAVQGFIECRSCLGLAYPSQTFHKTVAGDGALIGWNKLVSKERAGFRARMLAHERFRRRMA